MNNPLVSIIIPCYNVEAFISEAIEAALTQTYNPIEIICVDNGSTDGTVDILKRYEAEGKVRLLIQPLKGAPAARNMGWKACQGEWIQFLDADDLLYPQKLEHQMSMLRMTEDLPFIAAVSKKLNLSTGKEVIVPVLIPVWQGLLNNQLGNTVANLFNRVYLEKVGGWDESLKSSQEYDLMFRIMKINDQVIVDNEKVLTTIRIREQHSISSLSVDANKHRFLRLMSKIGEYLKVNKSEEYAQLNEMFFQEMFLRMRLNTIDGWPDSAKFYKQLMPKGFQPKAHEFSPVWFRVVMRIFGFYVADGLQKMKNRIKT